MGQPIVHHGGWFFVWSTIVDAPISKAMRRATLEKWYCERHGTEGLADLPGRIERAVRNGTSAFHATSARELISGNRAGPREGELSFKKVLKLVGIKDRHTLKRRRR